MSAGLVAFAAGAYAFRAPVRAPARARIASTVLGALAGAGAERVAAARGALDLAPGRLRACALGDTLPTTPLAAAFLDALAVGDAADLATPAVCAALALGEAVDASGATVLDAVVAGAEVAVRVARALGPSHAARGWDVRGSCGRLGAAVAAGRIIGLQRGPMAWAIGIAATAAGGLRLAGGTASAAVIPAAAAADGVEAALLARSDFTGAPQAIDGRRGLGALMSDGFAPDVLLDGLGERFLSADDLGPVQAPANEPRAAAVVALTERLERLASVREALAALRR